MNDVAGGRAMLEIQYEGEVSDILLSCSLAPFGTKMMNRNKNCLRKELLIIRLSEHLLHFTDWFSRNRTILKQHFYVLEVNKF